MSACNVAAGLAFEYSESPLSALNIEICMAQHLSLSALCRHWPPPQNAAARPVIAAIRAERGILWAQKSACGQTGLLLAQRMQKLLACCGMSVAAIN
jgi:hypothetical protein